METVRAFAGQLMAGRAFPVGGLGRVGSDAIAIPCSLTHWLGLAPYRDEACPSGKVHRQNQTNAPACASNKAKGLLQREEEPSTYAKAKQSRPANR
jgi:hypothetical protein